MRNKDHVLLENAYKRVIGESNYNELFDWLGGTDSEAGGMDGVYPGVTGIEAVKNMVLDTFTEESPKLKPYVAQAIDTLKPNQLLELILMNYDGTALSDLPSSVIEFHSGEDPDYFQAPDSTQAQNILIKAISYFRKEPSMELPEWTQKRDDGMEMKEILVKNQRKNQR